MTEEPHRWVEAVANRREYIETQLAGGSPIVAISAARGILLLTYGRDRQKLFEIYDRIAMGGIGHPGDLERLRLSAIEMASQEGFTRSPADVSLQRLALFALSPALKSAFEQIFSPPYLARLLFAEVGAEQEADVFIALDYDGSVAASGLPPHRPSRHFAVLAGSVPAREAMRTFLSERAGSALDEATALALALEAWAIGRMTTETAEPPELALVHERFTELTTDLQPEAAWLDRQLLAEPPLPFSAYRAFTEAGNAWPQWAGASL